MLNILKQQGELNNANYMKKTPKSFDFEIGGITFAFEYQKETESFKIYTKSKVHNDNFEMTESVAEVFKTGSIRVTSVYITRKELEAINIAVKKFFN